MKSFDVEGEYQKGMSLLEDAIETLNLSVQWLAHISDERRAEIFRQLAQIQSDLSY